jgi:hypothetical protein
LIARFLIDRLLCNRSIKSLVHVTAATVFILFSIFIAVSFVIKAQQERRFEEFLLMSNRISVLSLQSAKAQHTIDQYFKTSDRAYLADYFTIQTAIQQELIRLGNHFVDTVFALNVRIVDNIMAFCSSFVTRQGLPLTIDSEAVYAQQQFVVRAYSVAGGYIAEWLSGYISAEDERYQKTVSRQRSITNTLMAVLGFAILAIYTTSDQHHVAAADEIGRRQKHRSIGG